MTAFEKLIDALRAHGDNVNETGQGKARGHCPAHHGTSDDSLAIDTRDDGNGVMVYCHAGCVYTDVLGALNLTTIDLFDDPALRNVWQPFAKYIYSGGRQVNRRVDANGKKTFHQSGNTKTDRSLFGADRIGTRAVVYVPEGEKDVLAIEAVGQAACCSAMGAGKAHIADWSPLTGKHVIIIADNDDPGINHAEDIHDILDGIAASVSTVNAAVGKDVSDHIAAGKKLSDLVRITGFDATVPVPLTRIVSFVSFPVGSFPAAIADMITAVAEATQTDEAMPGTCAISALSAAAGGNVEVQIRNDWIEPLCTYSVTVADSGERKSVVQRAMLKPVLDAEAQLAELIFPRRRDALARRELADKQAVTLIAKSAKVNRASLSFADLLAQEQDVIDARKAVDDIEVPELPRLVADDLTPEAAASLLHECGGSIAVVSAEGDLFDIIGGRYSGNIPNMGVWLKAHSGDMIRVDRKGRAPEYIRKPAMTLGLMAQPEVLKAIAAQPSLRGRGLLARFLYAMPASNVGNRKTNANAVPDAISKAYDTVIHGLAMGLQKKHPADAPTVLKFTPGAMAAIATLEAETELALREDAPLGSLRDWGGKYVAAIARIAGLLHLAEYGVKGLQLAVTSETVWHAADLGTYFKFNAISAFEVMALDPTIADAVYLLGKLKAHPDSTISVRDMQRAARKFQKKADLQAAIETLVDYGWIQAKAAQQTGRGRPSSPTYKIHPLAQA